MSNFVKFLGLAFLCLIWGANWVAIKISLEGLPPFISAGIRFGVAIIFLFIYIKGRGISLKVNARELRLLLGVGFITYVLDYGFIYWGEQYLSAGVTSIFFSTFALFTALLSNFIFKNEPLSWKKYFGITVGIIGIMVVFFDQLVITRFSSKVILASVAIILSALFAALATVMIKKYFSHMKPEILSFYQMIIGTFLLLLVGLSVDNLQQIQLNHRVILAMAFMGLMASAAAFVIYYSLLKHMSAISLSLMIYIIPIVALGTDYLFYGQVLSLRSFIGTAIIFSGIGFSQIDRKIYLPKKRPIS